MRLTLLVLPLVLLAGCMAESDRTASASPAPAPREDPGTCCACYTSTSCRAGRAESCTKAGHC